MLREWARDELWTADLPAGPGSSRFGARMTVVRLPDGGVFLHSPIGRTAELAGQVETLGPVRALVSPSRFHYLHLAEWADACLDARVYVPPSFKRKLPTASGAWRL